MRPRFALAFLGIAACSTNPTPAVRPTAIPIRIDRELFAEYRFTEDDRTPILYPLLGPGGIGVTRNFPMRSVPGESTDTRTTARSGSLTAT